MKQKKLHHRKCVYRIGALLFVGGNAYGISKWLFALWQDISSDIRPKGFLSGRDTGKLTYAIIASDADYRFTVARADGTPIPQEMDYGGETIFLCLSRM